MHATPDKPLRDAIGRVLIGTALLLLIPLAGALLSDEMRWGPGDFVVAAVLLAATGGAFVLAARRLRTAGARLAAGAALAALLALVWAELAVGVFGTPFAGS